MDDLPLPLDGFLDCCCLFGLFDFVDSLYEHLMQLPSMPLRDIGVVGCHHIGKTFPKEVVVVLSKRQLEGGLFEVRLHVRLCQDSVS